MKNSRRWRRGCAPPQGFPGAAGLFSNVATSRADCRPRRPSRDFWTRDSPQRREGWTRSNRKPRAATFQRLARQRCRSIRNMQSRLETRARRRAISRFASHRSSDSIARARTASIFKTDAIGLTHGLRTVSGRNFHAIAGKKMKTGHRKLASDSHGEPKNQIKWQIMAAAILSAASHRRENFAEASKIPISQSRKNRAYCAHDSMLWMPSPGRYS